MLEIFGKPLHEMTDTELKERLSFLKQQRLSKQSAKIAKKPIKKPPLHEQDLLDAIVLLAKKATIKEPLK